MLEVGPFAIMGKWDASAAPAGKLIIRLVPQRVDFSFANAWKPSSQAFLRNMEPLVLPGNTVNDIGTGTGLLALAALALGASKVTAVEPEGAGIQYANANFAANGVASQVDLKQGWYGVNSYTLDAADPLPLARADVVLCNIDTFQVLEVVLRDHLAPKIAMMPNTREFAAFEALIVATGHRMIQNELVAGRYESFNYVVVEENNA